VLHQNIVRDSLGLMDFDLLFCLLIVEGLALDLVKRNEFDDERAL
jgi:hypothetical protein